jgi:hypothetical protein
MNLHTARKLYSIAISIQAMKPVCIHGLQDLNTWIKVKVACMDFTKVGYVTCTIHFIKPITWTLHNFSLGIFKKNGTSTAVDVVHCIEEHMKTCNLSYHSLTCIVTNIDSMTIAAGHLFKEKSFENHILA